MSENPAIIWFRKDLRLSDNPALAAAIESKSPIIPIFIWAPEEEKPWMPGEASQWWLHHSLLDLDNELKKLGSKLYCFKGKSLEVLEQIIKETGADKVFWNRRYEKYIIERDSKIKSKLNEAKIEAKSFNASLLKEPWEIQNQQGKAYKVYTPFSKNFYHLAEEPPQLAPKPKQINSNIELSSHLSVEDLDLLPKLNWIDNLAQAWKPGSSNVGKALKAFVKNKHNDYSEARDRPDLNGISRLSPYLHFGEISPKEIWHEVIKSKGAKNLVQKKNLDVFLKQIIWREFGYHLIYHFPETHSEPLNEKFKNFAWLKSKKNLEAWQKGLTGYPIVDAGMRELWHTGWMHNRVRMIVGSFLVKDLLISWSEGAKWFWDTLVDADLANNSLGWQWIGGCGADAAPYFRVFNPILQSIKFDPEGKYIRKWVPELKDLPNEWLHKPFEASPEILSKANISLGKDYPLPLIDHKFARDRALATLNKLK